MEHVSDVSAMHGINLNQQVAEFVGVEHFEKCL